MNPQKAADLAYRLGPTVGVGQARRRLAAGDLLASELLEAHIKAISEANPKLGALPTLCLDRAMEEAKKIDQGLARSRRLAKIQSSEASSGPLTGLPYCAKDIFETQGVRTTYGSSIFKQHIPQKDAEIVRRIRAAGAVLIGKSNTPEFAAGSQTFNTIFGATKNPWDPTKTCGGSSGGAAVALATGMTMLADGSDLAASLRNPASFCGVVGLRPSSHLEPRLQAGVNRFGTLSMVGPMARSVDDLRELFIAVFDPQGSLPEKSLTDWVRIRDSQQKARAKAQAESRKKKRRIRLAWAPTWGGLAVEKQVLCAMQSVNKRLRHDIDWVDGFPKLADYRDAFLSLRGAYFVSEFGALYKEHKHELKDTIVWNIEQGLALTAVQITQAEKTRSEVFLKLEEFMIEHDLDGIAGPTNQVLPFDLELPYVTQINGKPLETYIDWLASNFLVTVAGLPAISIPAELVQPADGGPLLPVGMQIIGRWAQDMNLMDTAQQIEQLLGPLGATPKI